MEWLGIFLEAVRGRKFQFQNFWTEFRNFLEFFVLFFDSPG